MFAAVSFAATSLPICVRRPVRASAAATTSASGIAVAAAAAGEGDAVGAAFGDGLSSCACRAGADASKAHAQIAADLQCQNVALRILTTRDTHVMMEMTAGDFCGWESLPSRTDK